MNLTIKDINNIIQVSQKERLQGKYIFGIILVRPKSATEGEDHKIIYDSRSLISATDNEPIPYIVEI
jgi:hypothetical protein